MFDKRNLVQTRACPQMSWSANGEDSVASLQEAFRKNFCQPSVKEIDAARQAMVKRLHEGTTAMVIPLHVQGTTVSQMLATMSRQMPPRNIIVVNDRSSPEAIDAVRQHGVSFIDRDALLNTLRWDRLLKILNQDNRPYGKGMAVLAGYLYLYYVRVFTEREYKWILQHDADIQNYDANRGLEYLMYAMTMVPECVQVKMVQIGRGNERCMDGRSALLTLAQILESVGRIREGKRARDLFNKTGPYTWLLAGQFGLDWETAMHRPFATGYLEETVTCVYVEDAAPGRTVQVVNPNRCEDNENSSHKEGRMQRSVDRLAHLFCVQPKPLPKWTATDIAWFNRNHLYREEVCALLPDTAGPPIITDVPKESLLPSVALLEEEELIDYNAAREVIQRHGSL